MASTINATTSGIVNIGDSVATLALQTGGTTAVAIDTAQIVTLSKSLALLGSTSGSATIAAPAVAGSTTLTLPATTGTLVVSGGDLGTPSAGVVTNLTGTASININGTVGATTPAAGTFTTATARAAATQDSVVLQGRAGGTSSYAATITPTTLTASRTLTIPDATGTILQSGTAVTVAQGGTGQTSYTDGQLLIGNSTGNTLTKATLTAGTNVTITNSAGGITIAAAGGSGSPGGSTTQVQYNNAGAFGGISGFTTDGTRVTASTTIGVGGATPSTSGNGITFPATASLSTNPNTLDDYEEGTWTPTDQSGAGLTITTYGTTKYIKVGQLVTIVGLIGYPTTTNGSNASIGGLPYIAGTGTISGVTPGIAGNGTTTYVNLNVADTPGNTLLRLFNISNSTYTNAQMSNVTMYVSLTYYSTSTT